MTQDRNLLFGVFAVQMKLVSPSQVMAAAGAWAADPSKDLPDRLVDEQGLDRAHRQLIDDLVSKAVEAHGGDVAATLATFGGAAQVEQTFFGSISISQDSVVAPTVVGRPLKDADVPDSVRAVQETPGRYSQVGEYGRGGMGKVLLVHDEFLGRDIALKELLPGPDRGAHGDTPKGTPVRQYMDLLSRFLFEARVTGQLEHPSIVPVYELGHRPDGTLYYTMKLVRGKTLSQAIQDAASLRERLELLPHFVDLCQAIAYAHSRHVIHRDIKPANVMVGEFGETVVLDWGLAKATDKEDVHSAGLVETLRLMNLGDEEALGKTAYGQVLGTPVYMPPEQAKGQLDRVDERSDVYSLGAVLYELLTGRPPFQGGSLQGMLRQVVEDEPRPIRDFVPDVSIELSAICQKAMSKDAARRYPSAKALAEEVQRFQSGALVQAHEYTTGQLVRRFVAKNRSLVGTAIAAACILVAVTGFYVSRLSAANRDLRFRTHEAEAARDAEATERERAQQTVEALERTQQDLEYQAYVSAVRLAESNLENYQPDLVVAALKSAPKQYRGWEWGYLFNRLDTSESALHIGDFENAVLLPGLRRWVTHSLPDELTVWDIESRARLKIYSGLGVSSLAHGIDPDGKSVYFVGTAGELEKLDTETGELSTLFQVPGGGEVTCGVAATVFGTLAENRDSIVLIANSGEMVQSLLLPDEKYYLDLETSMVIRDDLGVVAYRYSAEEIRIYHLNDSKTYVAIQTDDSHTFTLSPDGAHLAVARNDHSIHLWNANSGTHQGAFYGHESFVYDLQFSHDGAQLISASADRTVRIWDVDSQGELQRLVGHDRPIDKVRFGPPGSGVVHSRAGSMVKIWDRQQQEPRVTEFEDELIYKLEQSNGNLYVLSAWTQPDRPEASEIRVRDASTNRIVQFLSIDTERLPIREPSDLVSDLVSCNPEKSLLAIVPANKDDIIQPVEVWDTDRQEKLSSCKHVHNYGHLSISENGRYIAQTIFDSTRMYRFEVSDVLSGEPLFTSPKPNPTTSFAALIDSARNRLIWAERRGPLTMWDLSSGDQLFANEIEGNFNWRLAPTPRSDQYVLRGYPDSYLIHADDFTMSLEFQTSSEIFGDVSFDSNGKRLFASVLTGTIEVRDASTGSKLISIDDGDNAGFVQFSALDGTLYAVRPDCKSLMSWRLAFVESDPWETADGAEALKPFLLKESPEITTMEQIPTRPEDWPSIETALQTSLERLSRGPGLARGARGALSRERLRMRHYRQDRVHEVVFGTRSESQSIDGFPDRDSQGKIIRTIHDNPERFRFVELHMLNGGLDDPEVPSYRLVRFEFLGVVRHEVSKTRQQWIDMAKLGANVLRSNRERAVANGSFVDGIDMVVTAPLNTVLGVKTTDFLRLANGVTIDGFSSFGQALETTANELESGATDEVVLVFERQETDQVIHVTLKVNDEA